MERRDVGVPSSCGAAPSDLLGSSLGQDFHVGSACLRLGHTGGWFDDRLGYQWSILSIRRYLSHQPQGQPGGLLDPAARVLRNHGHHPVCDVRLLHQGLSGVSHRRNGDDQKLRVAIVHGQHVPAPSVPAGPPGYPVAVEGHLNCAPDRCGRDLLLRCFRIHGRHRDQSPQEPRQGREVAPLPNRTEREEGAVHAPG